jgi:hypothetical protein
MPFFQNVFDFEFRPSMIGADRDYQPGWKIKGNTNRSDYMFSGNSGNFNLGANDTLTINYAYDPEFKNYAALPITITAASMTNVTPTEVVSSLNNNAIFAGLFVASAVPSLNNPNSPNKILIKGNKSRGNFRAYISNTSAETILKFNKNAPVAELPTLFEKYSIANRFAYPEFGPDRLILLDTSNSVDQAVITAAGFDYNSPKEDWQLLSGASDAYWFYNKTYNASAPGSGLISTEIKYPAGATAGFAAKKTYYLYSGALLTAVMETPYVITSGDLVTPP